MRAYPRCPRGWATRSWRRSTSRRPVASATSARSARTRWRAASCRSARKRRTTSNTCAARGSRADGPGPLDRHALLVPDVAFQRFVLLPVLEVSALAAQVQDLAKDHPRAAEAGDDGAHA